MSAFVCALVEWDWGWDADYNAEQPPLIKLSDKGKEQVSPCMGVVTWKLLFHAGSLWRLVENIWK